MDTHQEEPISSHRVEPSTEVTIRRIAAISDELRIAIAQAITDRLAVPQAQNIQAQRAPEEDQ